MALSVPQTEPITLLIAGNVGVSARAVGEHGDRGIGEQVVGKPGVERGRNGAGALAGHHELSGVGEMRSQVLQCRGSVERTLVLHGEVGAVDVRAVAEVNVAGAIRSEDEGVVSERVAYVGEVEDAVEMLFGSSPAPILVLYEPLVNAHVAGVEAGPASL